VPARGALYATVTMHGAAALPHVVVGEHKSNFLYIVTLVALACWTLAIGPLRR